VRKIRGWAPNTSVMEPSRNATEANTIAMEPSRNATEANTIAMAPSKTVAVSMTATKGNSIAARHSCGSEPSSRRMAAGMTGR
jgi:hypothetical protein